jgi:hypothetical protein
VSDLQSWLREVQRRGWRIMEADQSSCIVGCDSATCGLRVKLREGGSIPGRLPVRDDSGAISLTYNDDATDAVRGRMRDLGLIISEVEDIAGLEADHLAKILAPNVHSRVFTVGTLAPVAAALGMKLVLVPADLPPITLRYLAQTRDQQARRRKAQATRDGREQR